MTEALLEVEDLTISLSRHGRRTDIVDGVSFRIDRNEPVGVVGESGSGKSMISLAIMGLLPPPLFVSRGEIRFEGRPIQSLPRREMQRIRGRGISMIFQEPMTALNPVFTVGEQITEVLRQDGHMTKTQARERVVELFSLVGIPAPGQRVDDYPHQMSGGMRQRVMIAMALCADPKLLIADEPTTALDATIQLQIVNLLARLQSEIGLAVIFVSHNLALVSNFARRVLVMYAGQLVETVGSGNILATAAHPYTEGLMNCALGLEDEVTPLPTIDGQVPRPERFPRGCRFSTRCPIAREICGELHPPHFSVAGDHMSACFRHTDFQPANS